MDRLKAAHVTSTTAVTTTPTVTTTTAVTTTPAVRAAPSKHDQAGCLAQPSDSSNSRTLYQRLISLGLHVYSGLFVL